MPLREIEREEGRIDFQISIPLCTNDGKTICKTIPVRHFKELLLPVKTFYISVDLKIFLTNSHIISRKSCWLTNHFTLHDKLVVT